MEKADILQTVAEALLGGDRAEALSHIADHYPFSFVPGGKRQYSDQLRMKIYSRDGFMDRYSGERLVNPGLLRAVSHYFPAEFPYHPHWKYSNCHLAFWELLPSLDHVIPVALGGADDESNLVSTTQLNNSIKANWTLEQLRWKLRPIEENSRWDGLTGLFIRLFERDPSLEEISYIGRWYRISRAWIKS